MHSMHCHYTTSLAIMEARLSPCIRLIDRSEFRLIGRRGAKARDSAPPYVRISCVRLRDTCKSTIYCDVLYALPVLP